jgi:predicted small secreted protein
MCSDVFDHAVPVATRVFGGKHSTCSLPPTTRLRGALRPAKANFERQPMKHNFLNRTCQMLGILSVLALMIGLVSLNGCNTWKGAGKDIERTGEAMQGDD